MSAVSVYCVQEIKQKLQCSVVQCSEGTVQCSAVHVQCSEVHVQCSAVKCMYSAVQSVTVCSGGV